MENASKVYVLLDENGNITRNRGAGNVYRYDDRYSLGGITNV